MMRIDENKTNIAYAKRTAISPNVNVGSERRTKNRNSLPPLSSFFLLPTLKEQVSIMCIHSHQSIAGPAMTTNLRLQRQSETCRSSSTMSSPLVRVSRMLDASGLPSSLDAVSVESLLYFQPYLENYFPLHLSNVVRHGNLSSLQHECPTSQLGLHNQFGESIIHLLCRWRRTPSAVTTVRWLLDEVHLPLNVRDRNGRTPLHAACMLAAKRYDAEATTDAQFGLIRLLLERAPELLLFEDNHGKTPLDYVTVQEYKAWHAFFDGFGLASAVLSIPQSLLAKSEKMAAEEEYTLKSEDLRAALIASFSPNERQFRIIANTQ